MYVRYFYINKGPYTTIIYIMRKTKCVLKAKLPKSPKYLKISKGLSLSPSNSRTTIPDTVLVTSISMSESSYPTKLAWIQKSPDIDGEVASDRSGSAVIVLSDGLTVAIGASGNDGSSSSSGHAHIFKYESNSTQCIRMGSDID